MNITLRSSVISLRQSENLRLVRTGSIMTSYDKRLGEYSRPKIRELRSNNQPTNHYLQLNKNKKSNVLKAVKSICKRNTSKYTYRLIISIYEKYIESS